ncbi:hypothetical protein J3F83DRAFT_742040 [Trichoderma novae-zelandiae]
MHRRSPSLPLLIFHAPVCLVPRVASPHPINARANKAHPCPLGRGCISAHVHMYCNPSAIIFPSPSSFITRACCTQPYRMERRRMGGLRHRSPSPSLTVSTLGLLFRFLSLFFFGITAASML